MKIKKIILLFIIAILLEVIVFNITSYYTIFGFNNVKEYTNPELLKYDEDYAILKLNNINTKVYSLKLNLKILEDGKTLEYRVAYTDDTSSDYRYLKPKIYVQENEKTKYIPLFLSGETKSLLVIMEKDYYDKGYLNSISINETIPFEFNILRFLIIFGLLVLSYAIKNSDVFNKEYSAKDAKQEYILIAVLAIFLVMLSFINSNSSEEGRKQLTTETGLYNVDFVNALYNGQLYLLTDPSEKLSQLDNPYDLTERNSKGVIRGKDYLWDTAYYNGHQYIYFGILPAITVFLPFYTITKTYLKASTYIFVLSIFIAILLKEILEKIIKLYFKNLPFKNVFYSLLILYSGSLVLFINGTCRFYEIAIVSGLFYVLLGIIFVLKSIEKEKHKYLNLFLGSLFLALSVACRPIDLLVSIAILPYVFSIFIPAIKNVKQNKIALIKLILAVAIPYIVVGVLLMYYNYIRFNNPFEFGASYQLTLNDMGKLSTGIFSIPQGLFTNLFGIPRFIFDYPFLEYNTGNLTFNGYYYVEAMLCGVFIMAPICFSIFGIIKVSKKAESNEQKILIWTLFIVALIVATASVSMAGSIERYLLDYAWLFVLDGIIIFNLNYCQYDSDESRKLLQKILCIITIYSVIFAILLGIVSEKNNFRTQSPETFYSLRQTICFWE